MPIAKSDSKRALRLTQRAWLQRLCEQKKSNPSKLAEGAGLSNSTLTRFLDDDYEGTLSELSIRRLMETYDVPGPDEFAAGGFAEDVAAFDYEAAEVDATLASIVGQLIKKRPAAMAKLVQTRALEDAGFLRGDIVIIDKALSPASGDVVCAQVYDRQGGAETVLRVYRRAGPFGLLMPATGDPGSEPLPVDDERVLVVGVITESFRPNARRAA